MQDQELLTELENFDLLLRYTVSKLRYFREIGGNVGENIWGNHERKKNIFKTRKM